MTQYIVLDELLGYLAEEEDDSRKLLDEAMMMPIEDGEDAARLREAFSQREAEERMIDVLKWWAKEHAITGYLVLPTLGVDTLGKGN